MAVGDVYKVTYEMVNDDKVTSTSQHYEETIAAVGTVAEVTAQLGAFSEIAFWTNFWKIYASIQLVFKQTITQKIYPTRDAPDISLALSGEVGDALGDSMNGTTATLFALYGTIWSPLYQGRAFLPGLPEADAEAGRIISAQYTALALSGNTFYELDAPLPAPADVTLEATVFSQKQASIPLAPVSSPIKTVILRPRIATQRRRRTPIQAVS